jgi:hypothetical protein
VSIYGEDFPAAAKFGRGATSLSAIQDAIKKGAALSNFLNGVTKKIFNRSSLALHHLPGVESICYRTQEKNHDQQA